jgi:hypothetical protein
LNIRTMAGMNRVAKTKKPEKNADISSKGKAKEW